MDPKPITIFKGDDSTAFGVRTINVKLSTDLDLTNATAKFDLLSYHKSFNAEATATKVFSVEFSAEETKKLPIGVVYGNLRIFDSEGKVLTAACHIPFEVRYPGREGSCDWKKYGCPVSVEVFLGIDYKFVFNKPTINGVPVVGDKDAHDYGIAKLSDIPTIPEQNDGTARPLPDYLYALDFADSYKAEAEAFYEEIAGDTGAFGCSAVRRGNNLFRNYDWTFDDAAEFVVRVSGNASRFSSVGVASVGRKLTDAFVKSGKWSKYYKALPGMTLDGINEKGVVAEINVDGGSKTGWHGTGANALHILAAVRWVLDHGETAAQAARYLAENVKQPEGDLNFHFMVADANATYIVENGEAVLTIRDELRALTNFPLTYETDVNTGVERYNLLCEGAPITDVWFTKAYQQGNTWHSDFASEAEHAAAIAQWAEQGDTKEAHRGKTTSSGKAWWQTVHTSVYDFENKTLKVAVQETEDYYTFALIGSGTNIDAYTKSETDALLATKYTKPTGGIPKSDLASGVQTSLGKADAAAPQATTYTKSETDAAIIGNVENSTTSTSTTKALSANMGKELQDQIQNLKQRGRYLSIWDCTTGLAKTVPTVNPYEYKAGDYFIVGEIAATGGTNYRPSGTHYDKEVPSTTAETGTPVVNDTYYYDGSSWSLLHTEQSAVTWGSIAGKPSAFPPSAHSHEMSEVTGLAGALADKLDRTDVVNPNPPLGNYDNPLLSGKAADELAVRNKFTFRPYFKVKIEQQGSKLIWANVKEDGAFVLVEYIFDTSPDITTQWFGYATSFYKTAVDPDTGEVIIQKEVPGNIITQNDVTIQWWPQGYSVDGGFFFTNRMFFYHYLIPFAAKESGSYEEGEIVLYDGVAYKRNDETGADTSWVASHWTIATDADVVARFKGLKSDGTATDKFTTDLLSTQVAKAKIAEAMPAPIAPNDATVSGKAADALAVKNALSGKLDKTGGTLIGELHIDGTGYDHRALRIGVFTESPGATYITPYGIGIGRTEAPINDDDIDISWSELFKIGNLAPAYSTRTTYYKDNFCSYDGKIYQCVSATSGVWNPSKWAERNLSSLFSNANGSLISTIEAKVNAMFDNGETTNYPRTTGEG